MRVMNPASGKIHSADRCVCSVISQVSGTRTFVCDCREAGRFDGICMHRALFDDGLFDRIQSHGASHTGVSLMSMYPTFHQYCLVGDTGDTALVTVSCDYAHEGTLVDLLAEFHRAFSELPAEVNVPAAAPQYPKPSGCREKAA